MDQTSEETERAVEAHTEEELFFGRIEVQQRRLYAIALSYLRSEADALEAVQEASCRAWIKRKKLQHPDRLSSWLIRIVINCCMDELRRRKRSFPAAEFEERQAEEMQSNDKVDLERAFGKMKPKYRHAVMLKYYQDMTTIEIAAVLRRPEGTIKTWVREGLKQLRKELGGGAEHE
ncbi:MULTISPECIES: RNA polymerase sigma factor [Saccharibacillus]|uniref:Sigma-70 family RNA polymerase sigma factor n=1 Tax=Saccharibacillus brassicae TaxID=2583377 RepID=A0A4Y6UYZ6_SACBS|nr:MULTISPECIES: sigma-70 family RNA polymerase sigma factor [Saccharibacillus]MWJ31782.1 sigma-70 family RNA polymerase sigma factor [Saccharibacillus sp. WB 17]QDH21758.1 sigma-70 family RNA polymerase sigma factor [Saccharibacillus brassicae]